MKYLWVSLALFLSVSVMAGGGRSDFVDLTDKRVQLIQGSMSRLFVYDVEMIDSDCDVKNVPALLFGIGDIEKEMYSMILAAKTAGKKVTLIASGCTPIDSNTYPSIDALYME